MENKKNEPYEIVELCLLAGKIMLQNGAETYRVEDTMDRIAAFYDVGQAHSYVTPTGIIFSLDGVEPTKLIRILKRNTDLAKVTAANSISRQITSGALTAREAIKQLKELEKKDLSYPLYQQLLAAAISSACFVIMFQGNWNDLLPAFISGGAGFICFYFIHELIEVKFFAEFLAAFVIGLLAFSLTELGIGHQADKIIIGSVMPLVPGLLITNAVRDLMSGHLVSGLSKGADAFLTASAIGTGIAVVFAIY
ncbi:threonine/serine exporter family protein [Peribacillus kribbensis]|uniref:threonine/serine exporter family protein n=1 Tax=Peribacillus kribbensis TaxID=356658 RepID=UPI000401DF2B|nr:threonine/serine exporter family protein [Peribacillus kribbensis]